MSLAYLKTVTESLLMTVIGSEFQTSSEGMLHKGRRRVWLTHCSGGRSQITAMLLILDEARKVR